MARTRALDPVTAQAPAGAPTAPALELHWSAPSECPDQEHVRQRISELLRGSAAEDPTPVRAVAAVTHGRAGYKLALTVKRGATGGTRTLIEVDCAALSETAAFLVALSIDPNVPEGGPAASTEPAPEPKPPPTVSAPVEPKPAEPIPKARPEPSIWSLYAAGSAGLGFANRPYQPRFQPGADLGFGWRRLDVELRYAYALPRDTDVSTGVSSGSLRTSTQSFGLASCLRFDVGRFTVAPCAGLSLLRTDAEPRNIELRSYHALWSSAFLGARAAITLVSNIELFGEAGWSVPIAKRPNFEYQGQPVVRAAVVATALRLGLRFRYFIPPGLFH